MRLSDEQIKRVLASDGYPIVKSIARDRDGIHYSVSCGDNGGGDFDNSRGIWDRFVEFSSNVKWSNAPRFGDVRFHDDAGGPAFIEAAREQDRVAELILMILQEHGR